MEVGIIPKVCKSANDIISLDLKVIPSTGDLIDIDDKWFKVLKVVHHIEERSHSVSLIVDPKPKGWKAS